MCELDLIPRELQPAVNRALRAAFGVSEFEEIRPITRGHTSALVFRIVVQGSPFLLRMIRNANLKLLAARHFTCMQAAADAGLAPRVCYADIDDGISLTDFVEAEPFPASEALLRIPAVLRRLHALPRFPAPDGPFNTTCTFLLRQGPVLDGLIAKFRASNVLSPAESEELLARRSQLAAVCQCREADMVSSHNDLFKPDNILFDGDRVWLVDWEAAFLNDRYADLAVVANQLVHNDSDERLFLGEYFGQPPDEYQLARFFLMRQLAHIFYAMAFLMAGASGKPPVPSENGSRFKDFHRHFWSGEITLDNNEAKTAYGRFHWEHLVQNARLARFDEALEIVRGHN